MKCPLTEREDEQLAFIFELPESKCACPLCGAKLFKNGGDHLLHPFPTKCALSGWGPNEEQWRRLARQVDLIQHMAFVDGGLAVHPPEDCVRDCPGFRGGNMCPCAAWKEKTGKAGKNKGEKYDNQEK